MLRLILLSVFLLGCNPDLFDKCDGSCGCTEVNSEFTTEKEDVPTDTGAHDPVCNKETMDFDTDSYEYSNYPEGPYGFKESICWHVDKGYITSDGDTIHNLCFPDSEGKVVCLSDLRKTNILLVHVIDTNSFSFLSGSILNYSAEDILEYCNIPVSFVSIMVGKNATQEAIKSWKDRTKTKYPVLYDKDSQWKERMQKDRWPASYVRNPVFVFAVHTPDMKIWNTFIGWDFKYNAFAGSWYQTFCDTLGPMYEHIGEY